MDTKSVTHPAPQPTTDCAERALELYQDHGHLIRSVASDTYEVPSCGMQGRRYTVHYGGHIQEACSCKDFQFGHVCKHLLAVGIIHAARRGGVREVRDISVAAGDPFKAASLVRHLDDLEERCRHELLSKEERAELHDQVLRLRRRLGRAR